jgi:hypothetical protein
MCCFRTDFVPDEPFDFITMMLPNYGFDLYDFRLSRDFAAKRPSFGGPRCGHRG